MVKKEGRFGARVVRKGGVARGRIEKSVFFFFWPGAREREATLERDVGLETSSSLGRALSEEAARLSFHARLAHFNNSTASNENLGAKRKAWLAGRGPSFLREKESDRRPSTQQRRFL